jgi:hypothetical protein
VLETRERLKITQKQATIYAVQQKSKVGLGMTKKLGKDHSKKEK